MNGNSNLYAHSQIDNEINNNTLLSLITGGRYQTSGDIPPLSTTGKLTNENLNRALKAFLGISVGMPMKGLRGEMPFEEYLNREPEVLYPAGKNIFGQPTEPVTQEDLLSLVMGTVGPGQGARLIEGLKKREVLDDIGVAQGLTKSAKKSAQKFVDAAKKEGVDHDDMVSRYSMKADELRKREGELQLFEKWLKLFGTRRAEALMDTEKRLIDFLK
tara:strand:- start:12875 stop:13522 length:648 start_codon:yes stop_codon:yes gene_type:complete